MKEQLGANMETKRMRTTDGTIMYHFNGKLHSEEGPAVIPVNGKPEYYIFGNKYTKVDWQRAMRDREGVPFHKTAAAKQSGTRS